MKPFGYSTKIFRYCYGRDRGTTKLISISKGNKSTSRFKWWIRIEEILPRSQLYQSMHLVGKNKKKHWNMFSIAFSTKFMVFFFQSIFFGLQLNDAVWFKWLKEYDSKYWWISNNSYGLNQTLLNDLIRNGLMLNSFKIENGIISFENPWNRSQSNVFKCNIT